MYAPARDGLRDGGEKASSERTPGADVRRRRPGFARHRRRTARARRRRQAPTEVAQAARAQETPCPRHRRPYRPDRLLGPGRRPVARDRRRRHRRLGRRASAADPVAGNSETPAIDPDRRHAGARTRAPRRSRRRAAAVARKCRATCRRHSSPSRIAASTNTTASTRSASDVHSSPTCCTAAVAQGGSTITQQLAKNLFLTQERTINRKLQEALLGAVARAQVFQDADPGDVSQPRLFRLRRLWHRAGLATLFRQVRAQHHARRSGDARRRGEIAVTPCTVAKFQRRRKARESRARRHGATCISSTAPPNAWRWRGRRASSRRSATAR